MQEEVIKQIHQMTSNADRADKLLLEDHYGNHKEWEDDEE